MLTEEQKKWIQPWIPVFILQGMGYLLPVLLPAFLQAVHMWNPDAGNGMSASSGAVPGSGYTTALTVITDLICIVIFLLMYRKDRQNLQSSPNRRQLLFPAAAFFAGIVFSRLLGALITALGFFQVFSNEAQETLLAAPAWLQLAGLGVIVPVAEELCYRGLCYTRCCMFMQPLWAALLVSGLFAAGHGNVIQMVYAFPMALLITWFYERSGRMLACAVLFHMGANLASVIGNLYGLR